MCILTGDKMKSLKCSDVTGLPCSFTVTVGIESKIKDAFVDHYKQAHSQDKDTSLDKNKKLREIRSKIDTILNRERVKLNPRM